MKAKQEIRHTLMRIYAQQIWLVANLFNFLGQRIAEAKIM